MFAPKNVSRPLRQSAKELPNSRLLHIDLFPAFRWWWSCTCNHTEASKIPGLGSSILRCVSVYSESAEQATQDSTVQHNTTRLHIPRISPDRERRDAQSPVVAWLPRVKGCAACRVLSGQRPAETASLTSSTRCRVTILFLLVHNVNVDSTPTKSRCHLQTHSNARTTPRAPSDGWDVLPAARIPQVMLPGRTPKFQGNAGSTTAPDKAMTSTFGDGPRDLLLSSILTYLHPI